MHLQPCGVISQQRIRRRVRLVKAVTGKLFHQVKNFVGFFFCQAVDASAFAKNIAMGGHLFFVFFTHGAAQHVCATERIAAQNLRGLHHLLLVNHDAVGFFQHGLDAGVWVLGHLFALLAGNVRGDQVHGAGPVQRVHGNQVFKPVGFGVFQHALHANTLKLKHRLGLAFGKQPVNLRIVERQIFKLEIFLRRVASHDEFSGDF